MLITAAKAFRACHCWAMPSESQLLGRLNVHLGVAASITGWFGFSFGSQGSAKIRGLGMFVMRIRYPWMLAGTKSGRLSFGRNANSLSRLLIRKACASLSKRVGTAGRSLKMLLIFRDF